MPSLPQIDWNTDIRNRPARPFAVASDFVFSVQPGGTLSASTPATVTFTTALLCPLGVNGSDTKHYVHISGGTGTAEDVLITGGTAVAGSTGTLTFTPANNHSGAWTITSATAGIAEAVTSLKSNTNAAGGGWVFIPASNSNISKPIPWRQNVWFFGTGTASILTPATSSTVVFDADVPVKSSDEHTIVADNAAFFNFMIDASAFTGVNSVVGIQGTNNAANNEVYSFFGVTIQQVYFNNVNTSQLFHRISGLTVNDVSLYENSQIVLTDSVLDTSHHSAEVIFSNLRYTWHPVNGSNQVATMTTPVVTLQNVEAVKLNTCEFQLPGGTSAFGVTVNGTSEDVEFNSCNFQNPTLGVQLNPTTIGGVAYFPQVIKFNGGSFDSIWGQGFAANGGSSTTIGFQSRTINFNGTTFSNTLVAGTTSTSFVSTGQYTKHVSFTGCQFYNVQSTPAQTGISIGNFADDIRFDASNVFINDVVGAGSTAIFISNSATNIQGLHTVTFYGFGTNISGTPAWGNVYQFAAAGGNLTLTGSAQDIASATVTLLRSGTFLATATFDGRVTGAGDAGFFLLGTLVVNGVAQPLFAEVSGAAGTGASSAQQWIFTASAGQIVKLQGSKSGGTGTSFFSTATTLTVLWIGN